MNKPLRITLIVLECIAGFILFVFLFASLFGGCIAKNYVKNNAEELIGRKADLDHVGINLFTGNVNIRGLWIYEENAQDKFAGFDTLDVSVSLLRMLGQTVYVRHITLAGLNAQVLQDGTRFNFTSIIEHFPSDTTEVEKDTTPSNWVVSLHNIRLSNGSANYKDLARGSHWGFNNLSVIVPDFAIGGKDQTDAGITLALADGGTLKADAQYDAASNDFSATVKLENFALDQVRPIIAEMAKVDEIKGHLGIDAKATGNLDQIMDMVVSATASVDDVDIIDQNAASVASLKHLAVDLGKLVLSQNLYDINSVELNGLNAKYEVFSDNSNTFSRLLIPASAEDTTATSPAPADTVKQESKPMQLHLGHLALTDINFTYADHSLPDDFVFPITNIRVTAEDLTTSGNNNAKVFANLPNGCVAVVDWNGNISQWKENQQLRLNIKNLHLTDLSPYAVGYIGQPITDGIFSFTSYNTIRNSQLNGKNRIDIYKPTIGDHRKDVKAKLKLPVKAALYILKDKDDKVVLDVPIAGNIDSPEFNYMKLVWKTLGNLVVKVATSPARALGNLFGNKDEELFIAVDPTEHDFTSEQFYQIDKVAELAKMDENYMLELNLKTKPAQDSTISANHAFRNKVLQRHLTEAGVPASQFKIVNSQPSDSVSREGYEVSISLK